MQNLRPAPACLPAAPHTLTWGPWEECDSDGVSDAESESELAAAGSQEQTHTHGHRQTQYLGLGPPGPGWREHWTAAAFQACPESAPQLLTKTSHGLRCHPVVVLGTVSLCLALGPLGLWPGLASSSLICLPGLGEKRKKRQQGCQKSYPPNVSLPSTLLVFSPPLLPFISTLSTFCLSFFSFFLFLRQFYSIAQTGLELTAVPLP